MATASIDAPRSTFIHRLGERMITFVESIGDLVLFALRTMRWMFAQRPNRAALFENMYEIGVRSITVVMITGGFIGMVLAVNSYNQFSQMGMETRLGAVINISLVQELGPVLAATMLAGRVGSAMAAQLGTMKVTEQIDALWALGAEPIHYLVVPRFLACFLLIPMLTAVADGIGILTGWLFSTYALGINSFHYWIHAERYVMPYDVMSGLIKSVFFGAAIAMVACHRGFRCGAGAEGVGRASTESFVVSFVLILALDFFLGVFLTKLYYVLWPGAMSLA